MGPRMKKDLERVEGPERNSEERMELRYCPRCGVLGVCQRGTEESFCPVCLQFLRWICGEVKGAAAKL